MQPTAEFVAPRAQHVTSSRIVVYEPEATGHQMELLRFLIDSISKNLQGFTVLLLTTKEASEHPNCQRLLKEFASLMSVCTLSDIQDRSLFWYKISDYYERQWRHAEQLARGLDEIGASNLDFMVLPHLESIGLLHIGLRPRLFRGRPWATIAVGVRFHHAQSGVAGPRQWQDVLQRLFFWKVVSSRTLTCFGSVNPYLAKAVNHPKVVWCPEPAASPQLASAEEARKAYGIRPETCVILVFGFIDRRKCLDVLINSVARLDSDLDVTIFVAGTQHKGHVAPVLSSESAQNLRERGRLVEANRFIMVGQDIDPLSVADISWVFYDKTFVFTGNVLVRSAKAAKPVICRAQGVIGRLVIENSCGLALPSDDPVIVAAALSQLTRNPSLRHDLGQNGIKAFAANNPEAFAHPIVESIRQHGAVMQKQKATGPDA